MARKQFWFTSFIVLGIITAIVQQSLFAQTEYHIGSGRTSDGTRYFDTLKDLRDALPDHEYLGFDGTAKTTSLLKNATIIMYGDDDSLEGAPLDPTDVYQAGEAAMFVVQGTVNVKSADELDKTISAKTSATNYLRIFDVYGTLNVSEELVFSGINSVRSGAISVNGPFETASGATLNADGVRFMNNKSWLFGGSVDTYAQAESLSFRGSHFENNTGSRGGGVEVYYTKFADFTDATFLNNTATDEPGGAIIVMGNAYGSSETVVKLGAGNNSKSLYQGNKFVHPVTQVELANSLYVQYDGTYRIDIETVGSGELHLLDPIYLTPGYNYTANFNKTGTGTWFLGGNTQINTGSGRALIDIQEGVLHLLEGTEIHMSGSNDALYVRAGADTYIAGNNTIQGTTVLFEAGARLTFDLGYYAPDYGQTVNKQPMLQLSGDTLVVTGTRIDIDNLPYDDPKRNGEYVLIQGTNYLNIGDFDLWIGDANIDVSGRVSQRFGYSLGHRKAGNVVIDDKQLVLTISETDNTVLRWQNDGESNHWNVTNKNWTLIRDGETDSFIPGDTVQFFGSGTHVINLTENVAVAHNSVTDEDGTAWYDGPGDTTGMHVSGDGHWTFTGKSIVDSAMMGRASLLFDGSGSLTLANDEANRYSYNILAGTGVMYVDRGDQLGTEKVYFRNNKTQDQASMLHFKSGSTLGAQLVANAGGNGWVTLDNAYGSNLTLTRKAEETELRGGSVYVENGGKLHFKAEPQSRFGRMILRDNGMRADAVLGETALFEGGAAYVENGGELILEKTEFIDNVASERGGAVSSEGKLTVLSGTFTGNTVVDENVPAGNRGGAIYLHGRSETTITDSTFTDNRSGGLGGAIHYEASAAGPSKLTISATEGNTTVFSGNLSQARYDAGDEIWNGSRQSVSVSGEQGSAANFVVDVARNGLVDMRDSLHFEAEHYEANITKTGEGTWKLAGQNEILARIATTTFNVKEGTLELYKEDADNGIAAGSILVDNGAFQIGQNGALNSLGGNTVTAETITIAGGATLGFDLTNSSQAGLQGGDPLLTMTARTADVDFTDGTQKIDILAMSKMDLSNQALFNLATFNVADIDTTGMTLLYHGEDMSKFRQRVGKLWTDTDGQNTTLQIELYQTDNGVTVWTNADGNSVWNGESMNWDGIGNLDGSEQFLHGDAVVFNNDGAGRIEVNAGGVVISDQVVGATRIPGMTVNNFDTVDDQGKTVNNDYTFHGGTISGDASLLKQGNGKLTFEQENRFTGGMVIEGGTVVGKKVGSFGTGNVAMTGLGTRLEFDVDDSGSFDGDITGNGSVGKSGVGSLRLDGTGNNYTGGTTILGGELIASSINSFGTGKIVTGVDGLSGTAVFDLNTGLDLPETFGQVISGTGAVKNTGTTALILTGKNTYSGGTMNENGATLIAKTVKSIGTGNVVNRGTLVFDLDKAGAGTFSQNIAGSGKLIKDGDGTLSLDGSNTYTGDTVLRGGQLRILNEQAIQGSVVRLNGGTISFTDASKITLGGLSSSTAEPEISLTNSQGEGITLVLQQLGTSTPAEDEKLVYWGNLSGKGAVIKEGNGPQYFGGENTYSGGTVINGGRLVAFGTGALGTGDVINNSELEINLAEDAVGNYGKTIVGTGGVYKSGLGTLLLTGTNSYSGGTFVEQGHLFARSFDALGTGNVVIGSYTLNGDEDTKYPAYFTVDLDADETITREISGSGNFCKIGAGTLYSNGEIKLTGTTSIREGAMYLNGNSSSETIVYNGATLGGSGYLNNRAVFKNGSSHAVGHQAEGTLSRFTANDIAYEGGSRIYIKVGMNGSDQVIARDKIDFAQGGGIVTVVLVNLGLDDFDESTTMPTEYEVFVSENNRLLLDGATIVNHDNDRNILTAEGVDAAVYFHAGEEEGLGVLGYSVRTNEDSSRSIFLNLSTYDAGAVAYLDQNQRNVLRGLGDPEAFDRIYRLAQGERGKVADQLMPMIQTAMPFLTQRAVTQFNLATFERLRFLREPLGLSDEDARNYRGSSYRLSHIHSPCNYIWFQNYGDLLKMSAKGSVPEFQADAYGFNVGFDKGINQHSSVGLGMGGYFSEVKANAVHQSGEVNSYLLSAYGNWAGNSDWHMAGSAGLVFSSYDLERYAAPFDTKLKSRHDGTTVFASVEGSKKFLFGRYEMSPYLGLDFIWLCEDGYREKASGEYSSLALRVKSQDTFTVLSTAGVRLGRAMRLLGGNIVQPSLHAAWVHDWTESDITTRASFAGMPSFRTRGASMNRDRAQLGANLNMTLNRRTDMFAKFNAELARRYSDLSFHWGIRLGF